VENVVHGLVTEEFIAVCLGAGVLGEDRPVDHFGELTQELGIHIYEEPD
jgi:hypothetical protein